jgi:MFS family permease
MFFFNAFAFLEVVPQIRCMINGVWSESDQEANLAEYCLDPENPVCEIDYQAKTTLRNLISQLNFICAPGWKLGLVGSIFLVGIVVGCSFVTKMGDKYGRRPVYGAGLFINGSIIIVLLLQYNVIVAYFCLFMLGVSITARYYVGYTYNLEY